VSEKSRIKEKVDVSCIILVSSTEININWRPIKSGDDYD